jgi:hypothetical protein
MSLSEIQAALPSLTLEERTVLHETLYALEEGVSVEEWRAMNVAIEEELRDPSPTIPAEQVFAKLEAKFRQNAA